ncbi:MAG: hypothetical protein M1820_001871 [Bogoriella megaspora]|nr:MAG: hypothetical protein M1820_001871 [Bogoriella megaspora]
MLPFLAFPREIRDAIYRESLLQESSPGELGSKVDLTRKPSFFPHMLNNLKVPRYGPDGPFTLNIYLARCCRQVRNEYLEMLRRVSSEGAYYKLYVPKSGPLLYPVWSILPFASRRIETFELVIEPRFHTDGHINSVQNISSGITFLLLQFFSYGYRALDEIGGVSSRNTFPSNSYVSVVNLIVNVASPRFGDSGRDHDWTIHRTGSSPDFNADYVPALPLQLAIQAENSQINTLKKLLEKVHEMAPHVCIKLCINDKVKQIWKAGEKQRKDV